MTAQASETAWNTHREVRCSGCNGSGYTHDGRRRCLACGCAGVVVVERFPGAAAEGAAARQRARDRAADGLEVMPSFRKNTA